MGIIYIVIFFILFSLYICIGSLKLGLGFLHKPGPGFISFWSGVFLGIFALILLFQKILFEKGYEDEKERERTNWKSIFLTLSALFISILILDRLGFIISTIFLVTFLFKYVEKKGWFISILSSLSMTLISYYIFKFLLQAELPKGILGF